MMLSQYYTYYSLAAYALAMGIELYLGKTRNLKLYEWKDALLSIAMGVIGIIIRTLSKAIWIGFWFIFYYWAPFKIPVNAYSWVALFLVNEFVYYWFHRLSHEWRPLWAVHVNHHSSEYMNFSTACRTPLLNFIFHNLFWIPLPLMGFHPHMIFTVEIVSFSVAFFQHTTLVKPNKWLDMILNTPSHHRVHHAYNPEYINKNYGNILIIFDKLFGTFTPESAAPRFGITKNIKTYNLLKVTFHEWIAMFRDWKNRKSIPFKMWKWGDNPQ